MTSYAGRHAQLYDLFYSDKDYAGEAGFVHRSLEASGSVHRVLDVACGTGRHVIELAKLGYDVTGVDHSPDMIALAKGRVIETASGISFVCQDMRELDVTGRPFDAAVCLFDSIGYVVSNEGVMAALAGIRDHLKPGAPFVIEFWHAPAMIRSFDPVRVRRWETDDGEVVRISKTRLLPDRQAAQVDYTVFELRKDGTYGSFEETQVNRYFSVPEMAGWLERTGFADPEWHAGFTSSTDIGVDTWHVVGVARAR